MEEKKSSNKLIVILLVLVVGGFVVLMCGGVLAAISIPAFMRYTQQSKTAEAMQVTRQMADYAKMAYMETCTFPEPLAPTADLAACCGGDKCASEVPASIWVENVSYLGQPTYFSYSAVPSPNGLTIIAETDFSCGGPRHTVTIEVTGTKEGSACDATSSAPVTTHEFQ